MFAIVRKAKLKTRHIEKICKVSRITASRWMNGHAEPHPQILARVQGFLALVERAVEEGRLPFPVNLLRQDEMNYLRRLFREYRDSQCE